MTLEEARTLAASLAPKSPGHLITAADWNSLVSVLVQYGNSLADLPTRMAAAEAAIAALDTRVDALEDLPARVQALEDQTAPLRENYRLSVRTGASTTLVGQAAEIVFKATALDGSALAGPMPWLDIVTTWGRLRAAPGFAVLPNAEENALSVQFNNAGEVRVQLRAQFTKGFSASSEATFANALEAQAGSTGKTVKTILLASSSPQDAEAKSAFKTLHATYDSNKAVRGYADAYVGQMTAGRYKPGQVFALGEWEDHRATVMAFAKPDANPATPDPTRGVATVQVTFREWIPNWSDDYVQDDGPVLADWTTLLGQNYPRPDLVLYAIDELHKKAPNAGALGHIRNIKALDKAATGTNPPDPAGQQSKKLLKGALQMQLAAGEADTGAAESYAQHALATQQTGQTARAAQASAADAQSTKQAVVLLENRVKAAEDTGKTISANLKNIGDGVRGINVNDVADLGGRLNNIRLSLNELANRIPAR